MSGKVIGYFLTFCVLGRVSGQFLKNLTPAAGNSITTQMKQFIMMNTSNQTFYYPQRRVESVRRQEIFPNSYPFPCANATSFGKSYRKPTSVHKLRPGDIDVVGAMGDSLVAGNGALEEYAIGTVIEYRGVSWCAGGEGTWRQYLTLPNILKEFNPNLKGYSKGKGEFLSKNSGMNVAFPVSADADAVTQAKYLVKKMKADTQIDFQNDWKMITVFFGANDLCSSQCFNKEGTSAIQHRRKLMEALDYLYENLPRTFVNLIPVLDVTVSVRQKRSMMCRFLHRLFCTCFHTGSDVNEFDVISQLVLDYQDAEKQLVKSGRYDTKEDFTVVLQPFMTAFNAPSDKAKRYKPFIDKSYITYDCFHFSQKGHALVGALGLVPHTLSKILSLIPGTSTPAMVQEIAQNMCIPMTESVIKTAKHQFQSEGFWLDPGKEFYTKVYPHPTAFVEPICCGTICWSLLGKSRGDSWGTSWKNSDAPQQRPPIFSLTLIANLFSTLVLNYITNCKFFYNK